jgi:hypothetical protein
MTRGPGRRAVAATAALVASVALSQEAPSDRRVEAHGFLELRGSAADGASSWLAGEFGRLPEGRLTPGEWASMFDGELQAAVDWRPSEHFLAHVHLLGRSEPDVAKGSAAGVAEAYVEIVPTLSLRNELHLRLGAVFSPTSMENTGPLWSSPYTVTFSAINTWVAHELRPAGLETRFAHTTTGGNELDLLGSVFGGADTAGTLIGWRGWSPGSRETVIGEELPLPPLASLSPAGPFKAQRPGATEPFGELDGRAGYLVRGRWTRPGVAVLQVVHWDNRGDRGQHGDQYAWATRFDQLGARLAAGRYLTLLGEWVRGSTGMGPPSGPHVQADLASWYAMASLASGGARLSVRYERFSTRDRDGTAEPNDEEGHATTVALLWRAGRHVRLGLEALDVTGGRPAAPDPAVGGRRALLEARLDF